MKTFLIYKFAQHIEWESESNIDTFTIGIYGSDQELMKEIFLLETVTLKDKPVQIIPFERLSEITPTHLLYITENKKIDIERITTLINGNNTLLVSDQSKDKNRIMINFLPLENNKIQFELNKANIINANLKIMPDLLLLGGTEIDVAGLYKESQQALQMAMRQFAELSDSLVKQSQMIDRQNLEIEQRNQSLETQKRLYEEQNQNLLDQRRIINENAKQLERVMNDLYIKQDTLDEKINQIKEQEEEIENQRKAIEERNEYLNNLKEEISMQEEKIRQQVSQLDNYENLVERRTTYLYVIATILFLIFCLVFVIYRGYKSKKIANNKLEEKNLAISRKNQEISKQKLEIEDKNRELEERQVEIVAQSEEIIQANEEIMATNEALEKQKKELQLLLENLKLAQSQLIQSEKMASVGTLTAGIAHELNNPINFVSGNVNPLQRDIGEVFTLINKYDEIIKKNKLEKVFSDVDELRTTMDFDYLTNEILNLLRGIEEGANRSGQIVKGLRSFSRLDEERFQLYDIHEGLDSTLLLLHNKLKNNIEVHKEYGNLKEIECLPSKLNQVFMNILTNCIQAIEGKGKIIIQTISSSIGVKIIIKDTGKGMTPEVKKHIFEPFFTTKDVGKGTGLGLSISYGIIEQHNGNIDVISEPGKGSEFIISLPIK